MQLNTESMINRIKMIGDRFPQISPIRRKKDGTLFPLSPGQCRSTRSLIRKECCNYDSGICLAMDGHCCTQEISCHVWCRWFQDLLLPLNPALEAAIFHNQTLRKCSECGARFIPASPRSKYCPRCSEIVRRKKNAGYKRISRSRKQGGHVSILEPGSAKITGFAGHGSG